MSVVLLVARYVDARTRLRAAIAEAQQASGFHGFYRVNQSRLDELRIRAEEAALDLADAVADGGDRDA